MKLSKRMKGYESSSENILPSRLPIIMRLDGNSFSRLTKIKNFEKPFDDRFEEAMVFAAKEIIKYCSGSQFAYTQSDEISVLLRNDMTNNTEPFLANRTQKLTSLCAAKASVAFNEQNFLNGIDTNAIFDCRVFVVPPTEVNNYFLWRQQDCFKNFVSSYAYWNLRKKYGRKQSQKMLHGLSTDERQELIFQELGVNVNDLDIKRKQGRVIKKKTRDVPLKEIVGEDKLESLVEKGHIDDKEEVVTRSNWEVMNETPSFSKDRSFIEEILLD